MKLMRSIFTLLLILGISIPHNAIAAMRRAKKELAEQERNESKERSAKAGASRALRDAQTKVKRLEKERKQKTKTIDLARNKTRLNRENLIASFATAAEDSYGYIDQNLRDELLTQIELLGKTDPTNLISLLNQFIVYASDLNARQYGGHKGTNLRKLINEVKDMRDKIALAISQITSKRPGVTIEVTSSIPRSDFSEPETEPGVIEREDALEIGTTKPSHQSFFQRHKAIFMIAGIALVIGITAYFAADYIAPYIQQGIENITHFLGIGNTTQAAQAASAVINTTARESTAAAISAINETATETTTHVCSTLSDICMKPGFDITSKAGQTTINQAVEYACQTIGEAAVKQSDATTQAITTTANTLSENLGQVCQLTSDGRCAVVTQKVTQAATGAIETAQGMIQSTQTEIMNSTSTEIFNTIKPYAQPENHEKLREFVNNQVAQSIRQQGWFRRVISGAARAVRALSGGYIQ